MSAQRRKIARRLEKSPLLKRELSEMAVESYGDAMLSAAREKSFRLKCRGRSLMRCATISSRTDTLTLTNRSQWPVFMPARRVLREIVCRIAGAINRIRAASRQGREQTYGQKFFDMHESSRLNMSFKCSGAFNLC